MWIAYKISWLLLLLGVILFVVWASKLDKKALKKWVVGLLVLGLLGTALSALLFSKGDYDGKGFCHFKKAAKEVVETEETDTEEVDVEEVVEN